MPIRRLEWDSRFFGYPVAAVTCDRALRPDDLPPLLREARGDGIRLIYLFAPVGAPALQAAIRKAGAIFLGCKREYVKQIRFPPLPDPEPDIVPCSETSPELELLALESGRHSRFRLDDGFRNGEFERLYREWLASSLRGENGKRVYVSGRGDAPRGLITLEPGEEIVRIGLLAVAAAWRGQGLGRRLVAAAEGFCIQNRCAALHVATQTANPKACRFYERCGFRKIYDIECYHAWLAAPAPA